LFLDELVAQPLEPAALELADLDPCRLSDAWIA
jgi:hypothetical protein